MNRPNTITLINSTRLLNAVSGGGGYKPTKPKVMKDMVLLPPTGDRSELSDDG